MRYSPPLLRAATQLRRSTATTPVATLQRRELKQRRSAVVTVPQQRKLQHRCYDACCNSVAALRDVSCSSSVVTLHDASCSSNVVALRDASLHRYSSTLPSPLPQSSRVSCGVVTSGLPSVGRLSSTDFCPSDDFCPRTSVRRTTSIHWSYRPRPVVLTSYALLSYVLPSCVLRPTILCPAILHLAFSFNIYLTSVQYLCVTGYSQQHTLFFKLSIMLEFCS